MGFGDFFKGAVNAVSKPQEALIKGVWHHGETGSKRLQATTRELGRGSVGHRLGAVGSLGAQMAEAIPGSPVSGAKAPAQIGRQIVTHPHEVATGIRTGAELLKEHPGAALTIGAAVAKGTVKEMVSPKSLAILAGTTAAGIAAAPSGGTTGVAAEAGLETEAKIVGEAAIQSGSKAFAKATGEALAKEGAEAVAKSATQTAFETGAQAGGKAVAETAMKEAGESAGRTGIKEAVQSTIKEGTYNKLLRGRNWTPVGKAQSALRNWAAQKILSTGSTAGEVAAGGEASAARQIAAGMVRGTSGTELKPLQGMSQQAEDVAQSVWTVRQAAAKAQMAGNAAKKTGQAAEFAANPEKALLNAAIKSDKGGKPLQEGSFQPYLPISTMTAGGEAGMPRNQVDQNSASYTGGRGFRSPRTAVGGGDYSGISENTTLGELRQMGSRRVTLGGTKAPNLTGQGLEAFGGIKPSFDWRDTNFRSFGPVTTTLRQPRPFSAGGAMEETAAEGPAGTTGATTGRVYGPGAGMGYRAIGRGTTFAGALGTGEQKAIGPGPEGFSVSGQGDVYHGRPPQTSTVTSEGEVEMPGRTKTFNIGAARPVGESTTSDMYTNPATQPKAIGTGKPDVVDAWSREIPPLNPWKPLDFSPPGKEEKGWWEK